MRKIAWMFLLCSGLASAQAPQIRSGATVFIEPMGGYEGYLAAAMVKKHVPLVIVTDQVKAEYVIKGTVSHDAPKAPAVVINNSATATINEGDSQNQQGFKQGFNQGMEAAQRRNAALAALGHSDTTITVVDAKSTEILFAHSAGKGGTNQLQKTAEDCANQLKKFIEKSEKGKKK